MITDNALLGCVLCGVGLRLLVKRRTTAKKQWFTERDNAAQRGRARLCTCVYVVRSWQEQATQGHEIVMRYALDTPATGRRRGFTSIKTLLDGLSTELTGAQEAQPHAE